MPQSATPAVLKLYQSLSRRPLGKALFSRALCFRAPYFASIRPTVIDLRSGYCEVRMRKRRAVLNHIGTVHAIAMCNMAELSAGLMTDVSIPATHRWIPKGMAVEYLKKATTTLRAVAQPESTQDWSKAGEYPVKVDVQDAAGETVFRARITMWVSPKKSSPEAP